jgi:hypothetical protein
MLIIIEFNSFFWPRAFAHLAHLFINKEEMKWSNVTNANKNETICYCNKNKARNERYK